MKVSINITVNLVASKKSSLTKFEFYEAIVESKLLMYKLSLERINNELVVRKKR